MPDGTVSFRYDGYENYPDGNVMEQGGVLSGCDASVGGSATADVPRLMRYLRRSVDHLVILERVRAHDEREH